MAYQFIALTKIVENFTAVYVGEGKILGSTFKGDVNYHAHRALQELSYDTLKSCKEVEQVVPASLTMALPNDYINYTKITWEDDAGIKRVIYPTNKVLNAQSTSTPASDPDYDNNLGTRFGLDPQHAQINGSFYINCTDNTIDFSSNLADKTITLHYLSDHHGTTGEMIVHKFAEEAMYKWIAYGCASARLDVPENVIQRLKKEKIAETRKAKIRLSNIKIEEISQVFRGKSKWIKH